MSVHSAKGMKSIWLLIVLNLFIFVASLPTLSLDNETRAFIEITELGYEDICYETSEAEWSFVNSPSNETLAKWEKKENDYADYKKLQKEEVGNVTKNNLNSPDLLYKYDVIEKAGDGLMNGNDWREFIHFAGTARLLRWTATYTGKTKKYSRQDAERLLSHMGDAAKKRDVWNGWHKELTPLLANYSRVLTLLPKAAKINNADSLEQYWENLSGFPDGYENIKLYWDRIANLHKKIVKFAKMILGSKYGVKMNESIPAYLLGSLEGYDWTPLSLDLTPYPQLTYNVRKNLWKRKLVGKSLYKVASNMGSTVLSQVPQADFWDHSVFKGTCPPKLINFCQDGKMRVSTCYDATTSNFLSAHRNVGKTLVNQMSFQSTPILNTANRYSGVEEGITELFGILSASPAWWNYTQLLNVTDMNQEVQIVSLMITALDVLPRLAYYLAADMWRINAIETGKMGAGDLVSSWWKYRQQYEMITSDTMDIPTFLNDDYIITNKPYLPKFIGVVIGFQLYEYIMESTEVRYDQINGRTLTANLIKMIQQGSAEDWMKNLEKYFEIDEILIDSLTNFFMPLEDYIEEYMEDFEYKPRTAQEKEFEEFEKRIIHEINTPVTTTTSRPVTTTIRRVLNTTPKPKVNVKSNDKPKPVLNSESSVQADKPVDQKKPEDSVKIPDEESSTADAEEEENQKPKINTGKAVWAVGAVLLATVTICIIAIFGRQRCRKTPKNRRYV